MISSRSRSKAPLSSSLSSPCLVVSSFSTSLRFSSKRDTSSLRDTSSFSTSLWCSSRRDASSFSTSLRDTSSFTSFPRRSSRRDTSSLWRSSRRDTSSFSTSLRDNSSFTSFPWLSSRRDTSSLWRSSRRDTSSFSTSLRDTSSLSIPSHLFSSFSFSSSAFSFSSLSRSCSIPSYARRSLASAVRSTSSWASSHCSLSCCSFSSCSLTSRSIPASSTSCRVWLLCSSSTALSLRCSSESLSASASFSCSDLSCASSIRAISSTPCATSSRVRILSPSSRASRSSTSCSCFSWRCLSSRAWHLFSSSTRWASSSAATASCSFRSAARGRLLQHCPLQHCPLQLGLEVPGLGLDAGHLLPEGPDLLLVLGGGGGLLGLVGLPLLLHPLLQLMDLCLAFLASEETYSALCLVAAAQLPEAFLLKEQLRAARLHDALQAGLQLGDLDQGLREPLAAVQNLHLQPPVLLRGTMKSSVAGLLLDLLHLRQQLRPHRPQPLLVLLLQLPVRWSLRFERVELEVDVVEVAYLRLRWCETSMAAWCSSTSAASWLFSLSAFSSLEADQRCLVETVPGGQQLVLQGRGQLHQVHPAFHLKVQRLHTA
ncbi:hypothetical protein CRUP_031081 [Coryphaenoides rupestris]|nr:hypothetical protein CRUP_031081 [Coryphaenoides rupestris]